MERPTPSFGAVVDEHGFPVFDDPRLFARYLKRLAGKRVRFEIRKERKLRTIPQNKRLRVIYTYASEWSGMEPDEIHEAVKAMLLPERTFRLPNGREMTAPPTTTTLDTEAFGYLMDRIERFLYEQGMPAIPWENYR